MPFFIFKTLSTALIIAGITEVSKRSSFLGAVFTSLPLTSLLVFLWIYLENKNTEQITKMSWEVLGLIIPSLLFFIVLPICLKRGFHFYSSLSFSVLVTAAGYFIYLKLSSIRS